MLWLLACTPAPLKAQAPGATTTLDAAELVAAADLDGDGLDELISVSEGVLRWPGGEQAIGGAPARSARGVIDGREVALVATGMSRDHKGVPAQIWMVSSEGAELALDLPTARAQIPTLEVIDGKIWAALFRDTYTVEGGWVENGAFTSVASGRLAEAQVPLGDQVAVGRVYGDEPRSDGDLILSPSGTKLPVFRGVRQLERADVDGDGDLDLLVADGWHSNYGAIADGRVLLLRGPDWTQGSVIAHLGADYTAESMDLQGNDLLVNGPLRTHLLRRDAVGWVDFDLGESGGNAVFVTTPDGPAVWIAGDPSRLVML
jgi:hypothetical protein